MNIFAWDLVERALRILQPSHFHRWCAERSAGYDRLRGSVGNRLRMRSAGGDQAQRQKSFAQAGEKEPVHHRLDALVYSVRWIKSDAKRKMWHMEHDHYK